MNISGDSDRYQAGVLYGSYANPSYIIRELPVDIIQFIKNLYEINPSYLENNIESVKREISFEHPTTSRIDTLSFLSSIIYLNPDELRLFIQENYVYLHGILYACKVTCEFFEKDTQISLEVVEDVDSGEKSVFLFIRSNNYTDDFHEKLKTVRSIYRSAGYLDSIDFSVTTDYQPPLSLS